MNLETLIANYGYLAVLAGTFFEGESIMILGGFFAFRGYLELPWVFLYGFMGTYISESVFYYLGKTKGAQMLKRRRKWQQKSRRIIEILHRHKYLLIIGHRFVYGMRSITPFVVGVSGIPALTFAVLNMVGSAIWTLALGTAGYFFGRTLTAYIAKAEAYEHWVLLAIFCIIFIIWSVSYYLGRYITDSR